MNSFSDGWIFNKIIEKLLFRFSRLFLEFNVWFKFEVDVEFDVWFEFEVDVEFDVWFEF